MAQSQKMKITKLLWFSLVLLVTLWHTASGTKELQQDVPDILETFGNFDYVVAIRDVNKDPVLKCLTSTRISYNTAAPSATYVWSLNGGQGQEREHMLVTFTPASTKDTAFYTTELSGNTKTETENPAKLLYVSNEEGCAVLEMSPFGYQCTLWVSDEVKDNVGEHCRAVYDELCGPSISIYDKETCADSEA
ncbi:uncharacterized protein LOC144151459 [Haemaphysalis longicornis]